METLTCQFCNKPYSTRSVKNLTFFAEPAGCFPCFEKMTAQPINVTCFGKETVRRGDRVVPGHFAYDPLAVECKAEGGICPFRLICPKFANGQIREMHYELLEVYPMIPFKQKDTIVYKAFQMCLAGTTMSKLRKFVESEKGDPVRVLRHFRKGEANGATWDFDEVGESIRIYLHHK